MVLESRATGQDVGVELRIHLNHVLLFLRLLFLQLKFNVDLFPFSPCFPQVNSSFLIASKTLLMMIPKILPSVLTLLPGYRFMYPTASQIHEHSLHPVLAWIHHLLPTPSFSLPSPTLATPGVILDSSTFYILLDIKSCLFFPKNMSQNTIFFHSHCHYPD